MRVALAFRALQNVLQNQSAANELVSLFKNFWVGAWLPPNCAPEHYGCAWLRRPVERIHGHELASRYNNVAE